VTGPVRGGPRFFLPASPRLALGERRRRDEYWGASLGAPVVACLALQSVCLRCCYLRFPPPLTPCCCYRWRLPCRKRPPGQHAFVFVSRLRRAAVHIETSAGRQLHPRLQGACPSCWSSARCPHCLLFGCAAGVTRAFAWVFATQQMGMIGGRCSPARRSHLCRHESSALRNPPLLALMRAASLSR